MDKISIELLEFPKVRDILALYTSFSISHDLAKTLMPSTDFKEVSLWLKQSSEARHLLSIKPNFSIGEATDIREMVKIAAKGKILDPDMLNHIKETLGSSRVARNGIQKLESEVPELWNIVKEIADFAEIEHEVARCITSDGEILDSASRKLQFLRGQAREVRQRLIDKLETILRSKDKQKFIQESYITERENRYVLPVKSEFKKDINGIVHDFSNSGATVFIEPWETVEIGI